MAMEAARIVARASIHQKVRQRARVAMPESIKIKLVKHRAKFAQLGNTALRDRRYVRIVQLVGTLLGRIALVHLFSRRVKLARVANGQPMGMRSVTTALRDGSAPTLQSGMNATDVQLAGFRIRQERQRARGVLRVSMQVLPPMQHAHSVSWVNTMVSMTRQAAKTALRATLQLKQVKRLAQAA
jgi:hypothetical protein